MPIVLFTLLLATVLFFAAVYIYLRSRKKKDYQYLEKIQKRIGQNNGTLEIAAYKADALPSFRAHLAAIPNFLPEDTFVKLQKEATACAKIERSYIPGHKKGGTIAYEHLHFSAPAIIAFYLSHQLRDFCSNIIGDSVIPTPINDQSSCSLLIYDRPQDHIGWHYDYNFYHGRHFTVLLSLINTDSSGSRLSSAQLMVKNNSHEIVIPTPPNTLVLFEGAKVLHKVTQLGDNEKRVLISMTFCTDAKSSIAKETIRRVKDMAYFGVRALWS